MLLVRLLSACFMFIKQKRGYKTVLFDVLRLIFQQNHVIGKWTLLLQRCSICCHILKQVGDRVALGLEGHRAPRRAGSELRVDTRGMIDKVGIKAALPDLLGRQVAGELIDDRGDHLHVRQLFRTDVGQDGLAFFVRHCIALVEVAHGGAELAIRPS